MSVDFKIIISNILISVILVISLVSFDNPSLHSVFLNKKKMMSGFFCCNLIAFIFLTFIILFQNNSKNSNFIYPAVIFFTLSFFSGLYIVNTSKDINSELDVFFKNDKNILILLDKYKTYTRKSQTLSKCISYHDGSFITSKDLSCSPDTKCDTAAIKEICSQEYGAKLGDFYILSSNQTCLIPFTFGNYVTTKMIEVALTGGARLLDFDIYTEFYNNKAIPVVKSGFMKKKSLNFVTLHSCFKTIKEHAFVKNYNDPLFLHLNLKTNNIETIDRIAYSFLQIFSGETILNPGYSYKHQQSIIKEPICKLFKKIIFIVSGHIQNTLLDQITHFHTDYNAKIVDEHKADFPSDPISFATKTKNTFTLVKPNTIQNMNPSRPWSHGCHCVMMNFWNLDVQLQKHAKFFSNGSFMIKSFDLQNDRDEESSFKKIKDESKNINKCVDIMVQE